MKIINKNANLASAGEQAIFTGEYDSIYTPLVTLQPNKVDSAWVGLNRSTALQIVAHYPKTLHTSLIKALIRDDRIA